MRTFGQRARGPHEILQLTGEQSDSADEEDETVTQDADGEIEEGSGSKVRLRPWNRRVRKGMGYDGDGRPAPLIGQVHRLMHLWKAGDLVRVDEYLDARGPAATLSSSNSCRR